MCSAAVLAPQLDHSVVAGAPQLDAALAPTTVAGDALLQQLSLRSFRLSVWHHGGLAVLFRALSRFSFLKKNHDSFGNV